MANIPDDLLDELRELVRRGRELSRREESNGNPPTANEWERLDDDRAEFIYRLAEWLGVA